MAKKVFELTGNISRNIVEDTELVFPNVQTCVAVVAVRGSTLVGAHVTLADRKRLSVVGQEVRKRGEPDAVYVVGPVLPAYNTSWFANFGDPLHLCNTTSGVFIDVRARLQSDQVSIAVRPVNGTEAEWRTLSPEEFIS